jgi:AraC family transcriptional regulator of adaptative response/methylated-DNA-[protein]-cysteine methyltransferase
MTSLATSDSVRLICNAYSAHGQASHPNVIALLIPCHRVIRESGDTGQYRWGEDRKRAIIGWERAHRIAREKEETWGD